MLCKSSLPHVVEKYGFVSTFSVGGLMYIEYSRRVDEKAFLGDADLGEEEVARR